MASFTSRTITALHSLSAENHYVDSQSHIGFHARPGSAVSLKEFPPSKTRFAHTVCVSNTIVAQTLWSGIAAGNDYEKYLSYRPSMTNAHMHYITQKSQPDIWNRQLIQHSVFTHRFLPPQQTHFLTTGRGKQLMYCLLYAVIDSLAFLCTRHRASTLPKWELHTV